MSDSVSGKKQPGVGFRHGTSREKGDSSSNMSVYKSSAEESVRYKSKKESSVYKSSEEYFEYSCDPCKSAGDHVEAHGFCTDCDEYLCGTCFRTHSRNKASKHHTLLDKDAMPRQSRLIFCDPCKTVEDEVEAVGYCEDCDDYLCDSCYKSHSRNKSSRHHVLVDKANMSKESERAVTSSIAKMHIHKGASYKRYNEEYTYIRDINVKADTDGKDCYITAMSLISNNELVLCDIDNKSLKLIDIEYNTMKHVLVLHSLPYGITAISKDHVAVVLIGETYQIKIVSRNEGLSIVRTIELDCYCLDVKHTNGKLYVSCWKPVQFLILQPTGAIIKKIEPTSEILKHCNIPRYIAVSTDDSVIYVSDSETNNVMSMDMDGNMISRYQGELARPSDITMSPFGSPYLCNSSNDIVCKLASDLNKATVMLGPMDGLFYPHSMCFNADRHHLYIGSGKDRNSIQVYQWI